MAVLLETGYLDLLDPSDLEQMSTLYQAKIDLEAIRMRPDFEDIDFTNDLFDELNKVTKITRKRHKSDRKEKSPELDKIMEKSLTISEKPKTEITTSEQPKPRPKRISLDAYEKSRKSPVTPSPRRSNWSESPKSEISTPVKSLNDIIAEEEKVETPKKQKSGWGPNRRKQAKGQDIIRWEEEKTIEMSKRSPSSPWGGARPVQRGSPSWPLSTPPKKTISSPTQTKVSSEVEPKVNFEIKIC